MNADKTAYRLAAGLALVASILLIWLSRGMGIIGADGDPANKMYFGVIVVGLAGGVLTGFRPRGMVLTLIAMAIVQAGIGLYAIATGLGRPWSGPLELALLNGVFVALFTASAWLFHRAAQRHPDPSTA
jgi:hypothetical protein